MPRERNKVTFIPHLTYWDSYYYVDFEIFSSVCEVIDYISWDEKFYQCVTKIKKRNNKLFIYYHHYFPKNAT